MQLKYLALCAPLVLSAAAQAAPAPLPQMSSSSPLKPDASPGHQATFSSITIAGVRLGSRAVAMSGGGKLAAPGVFARHGTPDAVVVPGLLGVKDGPSGQLPRQTPDAMSGWAESVVVKLGNNHVQWLYKSPSHAMGFVSDRHGVVDAVAVAGTDKSLSLQAEGITGSIALGDDLRKVLHLFGFPSTIQSYGSDAKDPKAKAPRTFELRYDRASTKVETPAALVFTIRDNRVVRFYAFGE